MLIMAVAASSVSGVAWAAEEAAKPLQIDEIIVSASRRNVSLQDTPLSVTSVDPEVYASGGLTRLSDILNYTPGVYYAGGSTPNNNAIAMRGVSNFTAAPTVGIYIDDVPIGSGNSFAAGATLALDAMQSDMERVEIIKGPQGTLYGASSMGGLVRYITRDASTEDFSGYAKADISFIKHGDVSQSYNGRISAPIVKDKLGISVSGYYQDKAGFMDRIQTAVSTPAQDVNGYQRYGVLSKLNANLSENFRAAVTVIHSENEFHGANLIALDGGPPFVPADGPYDTDTARSDDTGRFTLYAGTLEYDFDWATLISSTSYQDQKVASTTDLVADFGPLIGLFCGCTVDAAPFTGGQGTKRFVEEVRLASREGSKLEWTIGGFYSREKSSNLQRLSGDPSNFLLLDVNIASVLEEYAAFGNLTYYVTPKFDIGVGVRLSRVKSSIEIDDGPELLITDTPPISSSGTIDTYSLTARYRPTDRLSLYARAANGYRPESANLPLKDVNGVNQAPPIIETDTLWSYEVGAKGSLMDGKIAYDFAGWYINWKNLQARIYVNGAMTNGNADSDVTAYGLEGGLTFFPAKGLSILTSFAYTHSTLDDDERSSFGSVAGENLPGIPKWSAAVKANYDFAISNIADGFVGAGIRYIGNRDTGFEGGVGQNGQTITPRIYNFVLENQVVADINAGVTVGNVTGTIYVTNLFDKYAYSYGVARPAVGFIRAQATVIDPRVIGASLKVNF